MAEAKQIIEINGKSYDANTGKPIGEKSSQPATSPDKPKATKKTAPAQNGAVLDGFVRRSNTQPSAGETITKPHHVSRKAQKSKTLMRPALKKPKHEAPASPSKPKVEAKLAKPPATRTSRAEAVQKSAHVSKFGKAQAGSGKVVKRNSAVEVAPEPKSDNPLQPAVQQFEKAMHDATSHLEEFVPDSKSPRSKKLLFASMGIASVLVLGYFAYSFLPTLKVKYAGTRAGFSANMPSYSPAGFGLSGDVQTTGSEVTLNFDSRTDDKSFKIKQSPSSWTSQTLLNNFVIPTYGSNYQVYESGGKTIYINNNSNATWVDGGIWYQLQGDAELTSDQLQRIVNSL